VRYAERPEEILEIVRLAEFVTEQHNPGNRKNVARILVELPSPRLAGNVSFMDTPGLGSLATQGAAETIAYLPKCDLGVVLIDAASTLTPEDVRTVEALLEAAVPVEVLLSKCDLLAPEDSARLVQYVQEHLQAEFHAAFPVFAISALPARRASLESWFTERIAPLCARSREMRTASAKRKIGALREAVATSLQARLARTRGISGREREQARAAEARLRLAGGRIEEMRTFCERACAAILERREDALAEAAARLLALQNAGSPQSPEELNRALAEFVRKRVQQLHEQMLAVAGSLREELAHAAGELGVPGAPEAEEFSSLLRETPVFEFEKPLVLPRAAFARLFGKSAARHRIAARLAAEIGAEWEQSLRTYFPLLRSWCERSIGQMKRRFDSFAEAYRAQAERALNAAELTADEERAIVSSLESLGVPLPEEAPGEIRARAGGPAGGTLPL